MVGSFVRFLLFTRCEGSLNSLVRCAIPYHTIPYHTIPYLVQRQRSGEILDIVFFAQVIVNFLFKYLLYHNNASHLLFAKVAKYFAEIK